MYIAESTRRQDAVVEAMKFAFNKYKEFAWGADHLQPITKSKNNWLHLGLTLVDSLDTLWMMGLKEGTFLFEVVV